MLKWVLITLAVVAGLGLLVWIVGSFMPQSHRASSSVIIRQPVDTVWMVVRDLENYAEWWDNLEAVERGPEAGREVWRQRDKRNQVLPLEVVEDEPPGRLVTRIADENLPFGGTWTYELHEADGGTRVTVTEEGEIYNPVFRVMSRLVFGYHGMMDSYLRALGARFEEDVTPRHGT